MKKLFIVIVALCSNLFVSCSELLETDVLIIGGGTSGIAAGIQSARMGTKTIIVEESPWLGGMLTSAGVSAIDGNYNLPAGIWGEFRDLLFSHYGGADSLKTGWVSNVLYEPSVGNQIFQNLARKEQNLTIYNNSQLISLKQVKNNWVAKIQKEGAEEINIKSKIIIDGTELGDVAKLCGVKYDIGMESRVSTNEDIAPDKSNNIIQDLTYVAILKQYDKDVTIEKPIGYDSSVFACCCSNHLCITPKEPDRIWSKEMMITYGKLPNNKYMINWPIEGNDYYVNMIEMSREERLKAVELAKNHTLCFIYFLQHELGYNTLGLADDEFPTEDKLPLIPYHRESRRIHGEVRFNINHIISPYTQKEKLYRTTIAVGDYPVDHHHKRYSGNEELPNLYFHPVPSYGLPMGTLIPKDVDNIIVAEKSISVSNLVNGSTRLQPVVLQIGQAAGIMASLAVKHNIIVRNIDVREVQKNVLLSRGYLLPYLDVPVTDKRFASYQRIGATGILQSVGKNVGWTNQTWLRADTVLLSTEISGLADYYRDTDKYIKTIIDKTTDGVTNSATDSAADNTVSNTKNSITISQAISLINKIAKEENIEIKVTPETIWKKYGLNNLNYNRNITRGEFAVLVDNILNPFENKSIDIRGNIK